MKTKSPYSCRPGKSCCPCAPKAAPTPCTSWGRRPPRPLPCVPTVAGGVRTDSRLPPRPRGCNLPGQRLPAPRQSRERMITNEMWI